jgi:hypothetical protein
MNLTITPRRDRMATSRPTAIAAALCALLSAAHAQSPPRLVALTRITPRVVSQHTISCAQAQCIPAGLTPPPASSIYVGGAAYDSNARAVWVSNGLTIAKVDPRAACNPECPVLPMPNTTPNNPVTGLAYYEPANTLYVTDQSGTIRWYTVGGGCQLSLAGRCIAPIPPGDILTGCATDDQTGQIFYSAITPGNPGGRIYVAQIGSPCTPFCNFLITTCGTNTMGPLLGLAWDDCADVLWITDGRFTTGRRINPITCTLLSEIQCCTNTGEPYIGLDVLTNNEGTTGSNCTAGSCPACPTLQHVLSSDPYFGNPAFSLDLINAPGGSTAVALFGAGPCGPPFFSPPLCASLYVASFSFAMAAGGTPGLCNGSAALTFAIPPNPALCGATFCSQYLGVCLPISFYVSNALQWTIGGS